MSTPLDKARPIVDTLCELISPATSRALIVGSIRRHVPTVNDGDIIYIPKSVNQLGFILHDLKAEKAIEMKMDGPKIKRVRFKELEIDLYLASEETWGTLQLIRTGSKDFNIGMARRALQKGYTLKADGSGLLNMKTDRIAQVNHEQDIFAILGLPYIRPEERRTLTIEGARS